MKIVIGGDYHANENKRFDDFQQCLIDIEDFIEETKPDLYLQSGDILDRNSPTVRELSVLTNHFRKIKSMNAEVWSCEGNHTYISEQLSSVDWLKLGIHLDESVYIENVNPIFMTHTTIKEAKVGPKNINLDGISYNDLAKKTKAKILIIGHLHRPQIINKNNPLVLLPGSIYKVNFGERDERKWIWLLDTETLELKRRELDKRKMLKIIYNIDTKQVLINDKISHNLSLRDCIVKMDIEGKKQSIDRINYDKLVAKFKDAYSLDLKFKYTDRDSSINFKETKTKDFNKLLDDYCEENNIEKTVYKFCNKVIEKIGQ